MFKQWFIVLFLLLNVLNFSCESDSTSSSDTEKPKITIVFPTDSSEFYEGTVIPISVEAIDDDNIKTVNIYVDEQLASSVDTLPHNYYWDTAGKAGNHSIKANATDKSDKVWESKVITVTVKKIDIGTVTDVDGEVYLTILIGEQWWMAENLSVTHYNNGDLISYAGDDTLWSSATQGVYCMYDRRISNVKIYGRLYNWYAVSDTLKIAPEGWHIPTDEDWKQLEMFLGMSLSEAEEIQARGIIEGGMLREVGYNHWDSPNTNATNMSGFNALPGGYRQAEGSFIGLGKSANFWTSSETDSAKVWYRGLLYSSSQIMRLNQEKKDGLSIRCIKD